MKKLIFVVSLILSVWSAPAAEATAPSSFDEWLAAVGALKKAVPEFDTFCAAFPAAQIRTYQNDKTVRNLTIVLQGTIEERYHASLIYEVAYEPGFTKVKVILKETLGVNRIGDLENLKGGQVLAPTKLTRSDLPKVAKEKASYLDRILEQKPSKKR
jgi:hypothetical protein